MSDNTPETPTPTRNPIRGKDIVFSVGYIKEYPTFEITGFSPPDRLIEFINGNETFTFPT